MSRYLPTALAAQVRTLAAGRCAFCQSAETLMGVTFEIDHVVPLAAGGTTTAANLCLSCPTCNRYKAARTSGVDPLSKEVVFLFRPGRESWTDHFAWNDDGITIIGLTPRSRATIETLRMNRPMLQQMRRYWIALGLHPPAA